MNTIVLEEKPNSVERPPAVVEQGTRNPNAIDPERRAFEDNFDDTSTAASWLELLLAAACLCSWFLLFCGGTLIGAAPFIEALGLFESVSATLINGAVVLLIWTISNIGILCMLSAILGAFGARTGFASHAQPKHPLVDFGKAHRQSVQQVYTHYASAAMRGFGVFVLVLSGLLVLATEALLSPDQGQYVRLAGMVSVISFYAGYDPIALAELLKRIQMFLRNGNK